ncbi:hypothetical protein MKW92_009166, partial [Papaver armeniacum]
LQTAFSIYGIWIPPNIFINVVKSASCSGCSANGWTRVIVEKPFGRDSESSAALTRGLKEYLVKDQIFRAEITVQFRHVPGNLYKKNFGMVLDRATMNSLSECSLMKLFI